VSEPFAGPGSAIQRALAEVESRIDRACERAGRERAGVRLLPVTKTVDAARVRCAVEAGYGEFAENRVQEAADKAAALASDGVRWHLVGHLQRNKTRQALGFAGCIQSLDRPALAERLADQLAEQGRRREVLLQVNTAGAAGQSGVAPAEVDALARTLAARPELEWTGLMTIARLAPDPEAARPDFRCLRDLHMRLQDEHGVALPVLSMGMSGDLEVAVEEGATLVRVGSAVFGAR
jgi:pyridoxal phosphate enzyme (YggS family)